MSGRRRRGGSSGAGGRHADLPRRIGDVLSPALDRIASSDQARAYAAWARAVGDQVAAGTRPKAFSRGRLTVECASSVWANELTYLSPQILRRMDELAPDHPVKRFRFMVGRVPAGAEPASPESSEPDALVSPGQENDPAAAKGKRRREALAPGAYGAARAEVEGVRDERLREAIEAALRRSSGESPAASGGDPATG